MVDTEGIFDIIQDETNEDNLSSNLEVFNSEEQQTQVLDYLQEEHKLAERDE